MQVGINVVALTDNYLKAFENRDPKKITACFAENAKIDFCFEILGQNPETKKYTFTGTDEISKYWSADASRITSVAFKTALSSAESPNSADAAFSYQHEDGTERTGVDHIIFNSDGKITEMKSHELRTRKPV